jgi:pimeloyl-ACP methyl ester carboxylesterase
LQSNTGVEVDLAMNEKTKTRKSFVDISLVLIITLSIILTNGGAFLNSASGQLASNNKTVTATISRINPLPVLLVHGYFEDSSVWHTWERLLTKAHIPYIEVNFSFFLGPYYDECGTASDHANDLGTIIQNTIQNLEISTGQNQVNIVAHSKGGLDARVYLANTGSQYIANLIMIGTPNNGSQLAYSNDYCAPAVYDIRQGAPDTKVGENNNTKYYTIAGDGNPSLVSDCPPVANIFNFDWQTFEKEGFSKLQKPNDGIVPVSTVESQGYFHNLGHTPDCHTNLLSEKSFAIAEPYLLGTR